MEQSIDHLGIAYLRTELPDLYFDFPIMAQRAFSLWQFMDGADRADISHIAQRCSRQGINAPVHASRLYVTTDYVHPHLVMVDPRQQVTDHMFRVLGRCSADPRTFLRALDCVVLWYFEQQQLTQCLQITPNALAQLLTAFYPENLVSRKHLRLNWNLRM